MAEDVQRQVLSRRRLLQAGAAGAGALAVGGLAACAEDGTPTSSLIEPSPAADLEGRVVRPGDAGYEDARKVWDGLFDHYPLAIAFCSTAAEVAAAITWARQNDIALRVRSGRHSLQGWSGIDAGLVIDTSEMKQVRIDREAQTATVGPGLDQGEVVEALGPEFAVPTGSEASVGLGGVTLGGGIGFFSRSMGLTSDNLLAADVVVPDGIDGARLVRADRDTNSDLLWACRGGGGGNFGVATSFTFGLSEVGEISVLDFSWPLSELGEVFEAWQRWAPGTDPRLGSNLVVLADSVACTGVFRGDESEHRELSKPLLDAGRPQVTTRKGNWVDVFKTFNVGPRTYLNWIFSSAWAFEPFPAEAIDLIGDRMRKAPPGGSNFWCLSWGGAVASEPEGGSPFPHRDALFYAEPGAGWNGNKLTSQARGWVAEFGKALRPYMSGSYVNVPESALADWGDAYYGPNFGRLREIKSRWDPGNVFDFEQSIPPA